MKHTDFNEGLQRVMLSYTKHGYTASISFETDLSKVGAKDAQWSEQFGTNLFAYQKQDRRQKGLPTATSTCLPVLGLPLRRTLVLMATPYALTAPAASPWATQRWIEAPPTCGPYVLVHAPRDRGDYAWTWRLSGAEIQKISTRLTSLIKMKNADAVRVETAIWIKSFSMYRGVRSQFIKLFQSGRKLWVACHRTKWPGVDPDHLPFISKFKADSTSATSSSPRSSATRSTPG